VAYLLFVDLLFVDRHSNNPVLALLSKEPPKTECGDGEFLVLR